MIKHRGITGKIKTETSQPSVKQRLNKHLPDSHNLSEESENVTENVQEEQPYMVTSFAQNKKKSVARAQRKSQTPLHSRPGTLFSLR